MFPFYFMWMWCTYLFGTIEKMLLMLYSFSACDPFAWMHLTSSSSFAQEILLFIYTQWKQPMRKFFINLTKTPTSFPNGYWWLFMFKHFSIFNHKIYHFFRENWWFQRTINKIWKKKKYCQDLYTLKPQSTYDEIKWIHSIF